MAKVTPATPEIAFPVASAACPEKLTSRGTVSWALDEVLPVCPLLIDAKAIKSKHNAANFDFIFPPPLHQDFVPTSTRRRLRARCSENPGVARRRVQCSLDDGHLFGQLGETRLLTANLFLLGAYLPLLRPNHCLLLLGCFDQ